VQRESTSLRHLSILSTAVVLASALACVRYSHAAQARVAVCLWRGGDDGLTVRLTDKLEETINGTRSLVVGGCGLKDQPTITLPTSVKWVKQGTSMHITARVILTGRNLTAPVAIESHCSDERLIDCANDIVNRSLAAWDIQTPPEVSSQMCGVEWREDATASMLGPVDEGTTPSYTTQISCVMSSVAHHGSRSAGWSSVRGGSRK
jgi:hypothetical protein